MVWIKAFHLIFVSSWFAGLFYLPRIFVNLAMVPSDSHAERERLLVMARKLQRFSTLLMIPALVLGAWLWISNFGAYKGAGWLHMKLLFVVLAIGFHHVCGATLRRFERSENRRTHTWYRVFNEVSVVIFSVIVVLAIVKPF